MRGFYAQARGPSNKLNKIENRIRIEVEDFLVNCGQSALIGPN